MAHRAKVMPWRTLRFNECVCGPYNADFDGDEMNMHVPQSYETIAEIKEIMHVPTQIVSPRSNQPVMGIVQDSLLGIMRMTVKDVFVNANMMMDIMMWKEDFDGRVPTPAVLKPEPLWTGKQLLSLIIPDVNFERFNGKKNEFGMRDWTKSEDDAKADDSILIINGELICGVVTKAIVGATAGGLIHVIWKDHGPYICRDFLSQAQKIINNWLVGNGFTVGVQDIIASDEVMRKVKEILKERTDRVQKIIQKTQLGNLKLVPGKSMIETFEAKVN